MISQNLIHIYMHLRLNIYIFIDSVIFQTNKIQQFHKIKIIFINFKRWLILEKFTALKKLFLR